MYLAPNLHTLCAHDPGASHGRLHRHATPQTLIPESARTSLTPLPNRISCARDTGASRGGWQPHAEPQTLIPGPARSSLPPVHTRTTQVPVMVDGSLTLPESAAILVYLAEKYDVPEHWCPRYEGVDEKSGGKCGVGGCGASPCRRVRPYCFTKEVWKRCECAAGGFAPSRQVQPFSCGTTQFQCCEGKQIHRFARPSHT